MKKQTFNLDLVLKGNQEEIFVSDDINIPNCDMVYVPLYVNDGEYSKVAALLLFLIQLFNWLLLSSVFLSFF